MRVIQVSAKAGADGRLLLDIPTGSAGCNFEIAVVLHAAPIDSETVYEASAELMRTCGAIDDETFEARRPTDPPPIGVRW